MNEKMSENNTEILYNNNTFRDKDQFKNLDEKIQMLKL
jgi:hypothetical protein